MIEINEINSVKIPLVYVEFDSSRATEGLSGSQPYTVLLLGESLKADTPGVIRLASETLAQEHFGDGSPLHQMAKSYFKNSDIEVWGLSLHKKDLGEGFDLEAAFKALKDIHFNVIACSFDDAASLKSLADQLKVRSSVKRQLEAYAFIATSESTLAIERVAKINSPYLSVLSNCKGKSSPAEWASALAGAVAASAQADPARPFQTLELVGIEAPSPSDLEDRTAREAALHGGVSTFYVDSGQNVRIERIVTTALTSASGAKDSSLSSPNVPLVLSFIRWDMRRYFGIKYARHKLASDRYRGSGPVMTPRLAKAECICLFRKWEEAGLVQDLDLFQEGLMAEINRTDPSRLDISMSPKLVNQLCILGAKVSFLL